MGIVLTILSLPPAPFGIQLVHYALKNKTLSVLTAKVPMILL
jgi:hypothetical protein